jgi:hypothetical protein
VNRVQTLQNLNSYQIEPCIQISKPAVKTTYINNRRYLGNKYKLLSFITSVVSAECKDIKSVADILPVRELWLPHLPIS